VPEFFWLLLIIPLATWRLTHILTAPERIAEPLHDKLGRTPDIVSGHYRYPNTWLAYLFQCYYCMSVWMGLVCLIVWAVFPYALIPLAASALTIKFEEKL
jgi:hypothetical protein